MKVRATIKKALPSSLYNTIFLNLAYFNYLPFINFETNLDSLGLQELLTLIDCTLALEGDIIECGASRCGTSILIAKHLRRRQSSKKVYAYDSFEGFNQTELYHERQQGLTTSLPDAFTSTSYAYVWDKLKRLGFDSEVFPVKGFFEDTLPGLPDDPRFALAFIDCDLQASMAYCAETLWPRLSPGGIFAFDDYVSDEFKGAKLAVDAFVSRKAAEIQAHGLFKLLYYVQRTHSLQ